jgi:hypothetical protein
MIKRDRSIITLCDGCKNVGWCDCLAKIVYRPPPNADFICNAFDPGCLHADDRIARLRVSCRKTRRGVIRYTTWLCACGARKLQTEESEYFEGIEYGRCFTESGWYGTKV